MKGTLIGPLRGIITSHTRPPTLKGGGGSLNSHNNYQWHRLNDDDNDATRWSRLHTPSIGLHRSFLLKEMSPNPPPKCTWHPP